MSNEYGNTSFFLPSIDSSKTFDIKELEASVNDVMIQAKIKHSFRKADYLSSQDFKFITWNTFSEVRYEDGRKRTDEEVKNVKQRTLFIQNHLMNLFKRDISLNMIYHNQIVYLYNTIKYPTPETFISILDSTI